MIYSSYTRIIKLGNARLDVCCKHYGLLMVEGAVNVDVGCKNVPREHI